MSQQPEQVAPKILKEDPVFTDDGMLCQMGFVEPAGFAFIWNDALIKHLKAKYTPQEWDRFSKAIMIMLRALEKEFMERIN